MPEPTPTEEVLDFLLAAPTPEAVVALRPSPASQERLRYLLDGSRNATFSRADFDYNGVVDLADFGILRGNFGKSLLA